MAVSSHWYGQRTRDFMFGDGSVQMTATTNTTGGLQSLIATAASVATTANLQWADRWDVVPLSPAAWLDRSLDLVRSRAWA